MISNIYIILILHFNVKITYVTKQYVFLLHLLQNIVYLWWSILSMKAKDENEYIILQPIHLMGHELHLAITRGGNAILGKPVYHTPLELNLYGPTFI